MASVETPPREGPAVEPAPPPVQRYKFSVEDYYRMGAAGVFEGKGRVELVDGDVIAMSPMGSRHAACVHSIDKLLTVALRHQADVRAQLPLRLGDRSEPEPDLAIVRPRADHYRDAHPGPADALLLVEVMETSAAFDRGFKLGLYARAGVPEVWLVDLSGEVVEVHRRPINGVYAESRVAARGESVTPGDFPDVAVGVDEILG